MYDREPPNWERYDSVRSINALIRVALSELVTLKNDLTESEDGSNIEV